MSILELIYKKRNGSALSAEEINKFIADYLQDKIPDYQVSALLMAIYFNGMTIAETAALTQALANSGETLDFSALGRPVVDKHSTGGVGDKTTLVLLPLVAAAGVTMAKMSGRGLGHTGGTIDKLSCIPGFRTDLSKEEFMQQVHQLGAAINGQTAQLAPADGKLYALRDVTATVESIPLIASSVMSKKIAAGAQSIVLDVKVGSGAFMKDLASARQLAQMMVEIGSSLGRKTTALLTNMEQPLGFTVGNAVEVVEAIETLQGNGPNDLTELALSLGAELLVASQKAASIAEAKVVLSDLLTSGKAFEMFQRIIAAQGGDPKVVEEPQRLENAAYGEKIYAHTSGYLVSLAALKVGQAAVLLGAGRQTKDAEIDLTAGIRLYKKTGDYVSKGEVLAEIYTNDKDKIAAATEKLAAAYGFAPQKPIPAPLIIERVSSEKL
ncbi:MAG: thymidine phosphorylase [Firmicutes bacterium]|nr:thymidine phosphorylase [Bacillota bacterium]